MTAQRPIRPGAKNLRGLQVASESRDDGDDDIGQTVPTETEPKLSAYLATQQRVTALRASIEEQGVRPPWPEPGNPMLEHLLDRSRAIAEHDGVEQAFLWLAATAWYEGGIDFANRAVRQIAGEL